MNATTIEPPEAIERLVATCSGSCDLLHVLSSRLTNFGGGLAPEAGLELLASGQAVCQEERRGDAEEAEPKRPD